MKITRTVLVVAVALMLESVLRIVFFYMGAVQGNQLLSNPPSTGVMNAILAIDLALGLAGLIAVAGLVRTTLWGYWATILISIVTIAFDAVFGVAVSFTAFAGLVLPVALLPILLSARTGYMHQYRV
jgi:hypothetical protein